MSSYPIAERYEEEGPHGTVIRYLAKIHDEEGSHTLTVVREDAQASFTQAHFQFNWSGNKARWEYMAGDLDESKVPDIVWDRIWRVFWRGFNVTAGIKRLNIKPSDPIITGHR